MIYLAQLNNFPHEHECLQNMRLVNKKSRLLTLYLFLNKDGLLQVGGRLNNSGLIYEEHHHVLITEKSQSASLFVAYTHVYFASCGTSYNDKSH